MENSDKNGTKAEHILAYCIRNQRPFIAFDMFGHGESSGKLKDGSISRWKNNTLAILDKLTNQPQILVGSSMGGWIMLLAATNRKEKIKGLIGIAPAPDFTDNLIWKKLDINEREEINKRGYIQQENPYEDKPQIITKEFIDDGRKNLVLKEKIKLDIPIKLIHGQKDDDVPWKTSLKLASMISTDDIDINLVKNGNHRLSNPKDLSKLTTMIDKMYQEIDMNTSEEK